MKRQLLKLAFGLGGILAVASAPAFATSFSFVIDTGSGTTDTYTSTTGTFDIRELTNGSNTEVFNASGTGDSDGKDLVVSYCISGCTGGTQTLKISTGSASTLNGVAANTAIYSASTSLNTMITGTSGNGPTGLSLTVNVAALAFNSTFYTDVATALGLGSSNSYTLSGGISGGSGGVTSDSLAAVEVTTPEPASVLLSVGGLLLGALFIMKRRTARA